MKIIPLRSFVIETYLPVEKGEDLTKVSIEGDTPVKDLKYAWHWYGGLSLLPGSGNVVNGKYAPPVNVNVWSPYFDDAEIFHDREQAEECLKNVLGSDSGFKVVEVQCSHYQQTWKYNP